MNYNNYEPEDFAADESFINFYKKSDQKHVSFWESWIESHPEKQKDIQQACSLIELLTWQGTDVNFQRNLQKLKTYINLDNSSLEQMPVIQPDSSPQSGGFNWLYFTKIAAAIIVLISVGLGVYRYSTKGELVKENNAVADIAPGGNKAILTLTDGRKINLNEAHNGVLAEQSGIKIAKTADGMLVYTISERNQKNTTSTLEYNTIETPKGGQYQINLPDGTKVWLNAASSIHYPTKFMGKERRVEINGEAYFEVAKNAKMPFKVSINNSSEVEVLGTHFNINSYADEEMIKTTLLEGSVRFSSLKQQTAVVLKPGEQSAFNKDEGQINVKQADVEEAVAWKNGDFIFRKQPLAEILKTLSRWYSIDVEYETTSLSQQTYSGVISRTKNLSAVISMLESTGQINLKVEGNKIIVRK
ncbi:DUF4974 domain-containing protein [Solitalea sp. MAHUQ-68]|uniref:DUF4974 domain-containing protein n=1 Tax=Solitalea agri TaxID=2953739 RepID=A0A9X2F9E2_9SPHI|nr:FecR domain-containing protein [Solitalea agri]MCO4294213.1 DUF4974 domain-containing protein [Solitalea agri]